MKSRPVKGIRGWGPFPLCTLVPVIGCGGVCLKEIPSSGCHVCKPVSSPQYLPWVTCFQKHTGERTGIENLALRIHHRSRPRSWQEPLFFSKLPYSKNQTCSWCLQLIIALGGSKEKKPSLFCLPKQRVILMSSYILNEHKYFSYSWQSLLRGHWTNSSVWHSKPFPTCPQVYF